MESRLFKQAYMFTNPVAIKNSCAKKSKPTHTRYVSQAQQLRHTAQFYHRQSRPQLLKLKKNQENYQPILVGLDLEKQGSVSDEPIHQNINILQIEKENRKLSERMKQLEKINLQKCIENNQLRIQLQNKNQCPQISQLKLLQSLSNQIQSYQTKRIKRQKQRTQSQVIPQFSESIWSLTGSDGFHKGNTVKQFEVETDISPKSMILAMVKELQEIYRIIPNSQKLDPKFDSILQSHQAMFVELINNKIRLNQLINEK